MSSPGPSLSQRIWIMQIIAGALVAGSVIFLVVVLVLVHNNGGKGQAEPIAGALPLISLMSLAFLIVQTPIAFILPRVIVRNALNNLAGSRADSYETPPGRYGPGGRITDAEFLFGLRQTTMIVSLSLFEGSAFFANVACLQEATTLSLGVSLASMALLLVFFPTEGKVNAWLEQQQLTLSGLREQKSSMPSADRL